MNFCLSDLVPPLRWSDASTITLLTGQPDLPDAWWRSLPMPRVLAAIGPESLGELLTEIALEHWPAAAVGDVLPALYVLDPDEADEPHIAIALDRAGSWPGLLALTGRELKDQPFIQARSVLNTLFSAVLVRVAPGVRATPGRAHPSDLAPALQPATDAPALQPAVTDAPAPQPPTAAAAAAAAPAPPTKSDRAPNRAADGESHRAADGAADGAANGESHRAAAAVAAGDAAAADADEALEDLLAVEHAEGPAGEESVPVGDKAGEGEEAAPAEESAAEESADEESAEEPSEGAVASEGSAPAEDAAPEGTEEGAPGKADEPEPVHHAHAESAPDASAEPVSEPEEAPEPELGAADAPEPELDAAEAPAPDRATDEASEPEAREADQALEPTAASEAEADAPGQAPEPAAAQPQDEPAPSQAQEEEPPAASESQEEPADEQGQAAPEGLKLLELIEAAFARLDDKSWAVAQNRVFTDEPSAVDQLAKLFAVPPSEISATEDRLRDRLDEWLAGDEAAPYRAHLDELRSTIGPSASREHLIGAADWHLKEVRALEVPAWQFVLATLPERKAAARSSEPQAAEQRPEPQVAEQRSEGAGAQPRPERHGVEQWAVEQAQQQPSAFGARQASGFPPSPAPAPQQLGAQAPAPQPADGQPAGARFQAFAPAAPAVEEANGSSEEQDDKPYQPLKDVSQTRRCFRQPDGRWWLRIDVTIEQLSGGECALPTGFATYLGLSPGESRTVRSAAGELTMTWHGRPVLESVERLLADVGAKEGGHLFLTLSDEGVLRARHLPVAAQGAEKITKALRLVGYTAPGGTKDQAARVIATRIGMTGPVALPDLLTRLRERGDRDLLALLD
ncbi:hypothetical protein ABT294_37500 [Nonomuraea sp. NPDC000554]|uniref:hypothetical protein n=1 Tax=Nonomuraea sp. NPDC000554 TaxID=3154259 RepID=UPI00331A6CD2